MADVKNGFKKKSLAWSFTAGGLVGAALALLYAPWEGRQTREKINKFSNTWRERIACFQEKGKEPAQEGLRPEESSAACFPTGRQEREPETEGAALTA